MKPLPPVHDPLAPVPVKTPAPARRPTWGEPPAPVPRAKVERLPDPEERQAKRAQRKDERQRRLAARRARR